MRNHFLKKGCVFLILTLLLALPLIKNVLAETNEPDPNMFLYKDLELKLLISNKVEIVPKSSDYFVETVFANLSWFPKEDYRQKILSFNTSPESKTNGNVEFIWKNPGSNELNLLLESRLVTKNAFVEVNQKIPFPIKNIPKEFRLYLRPGEISDITNEISQKAAELSEGKDELYDVVFTLGDWVKENVEYNLSSVTIDASQKASWVLKNKQGVCDELTSLFISFCRSVGIPAKFVSGMSYSDLKIFGNDWGPHGWAEVYFPNIGWVPFDVTYRQLGYLDSSHIKLKESFDAKEASMDYLARGRNIEIRGSPITIKVNTVKKGILILPTSDFNMNIKYDKAGFGSYNLIEVDIKNTKNYYVTADLSLSKTNELELIDDAYQKSVLLRPNEQTKAHWIIRVSENMNPSYTYTFPLEIRDIRGGKSSASFKSQKNYLIYSYNEIKALIPEQKQESKTKLGIECNSSKEVYYINETPKITCSIINLDRYTNNVNICQAKNCIPKKLSSGETSAVEFDILEKKPGMNNIVINANMQDKVKSSYVLIEILTPPQINIDNLSFPEFVKFNQEASVNFTITINPDSVAKNIKVFFQHKKISKQWEFDELREGKEFSIIFYGNNLRRKNNDFSIIVEYEDEFGQKYSTKKDFEIQLTDLNLYQKIILFIEDLENSLFGK